MKTNTRRGVPLKDDIPFQGKDKVPVGVVACEHLEYQGASITIFQRYIRFGRPRMVYTARVTDPATGASTYLGYHYRKEALLETARRVVSGRDDANQPSYIRMVTRQRAWELWYDEDGKQEGSSGNES